MSASSSGPMALTRTLAIIDALSRHGDGQSLTDLARAIDTPKTSTRSLLTALVETGYLTRDGMLYRLGIGSHSLAARVLSSWDVRAMVLPHLKSLATSLRVTAFFSVLDPTAESGCCIEVVDSPERIWLEVRVGLAIPLITSAAGRILLAYQDDAWLDRFLAGNENRDCILQDLSQLRATGVAINHSIGIRGVLALAVPVHHAGQFLGTISVFGPREWLEADLEKAQAALRNAGRLFSVSRGGR